MSPPTEVVYATDLEVRDGLATLSDADYRALRASCAKFRRLLPPGEVDELLNEAVLRLLDGRRRWPIHVPMRTFLVEAIRSIAWERIKKSRVREVAESHLSKPGGADDEQGSYIDQQPSSDPGPDGNLKLKQAIEQLELALKDDDDINVILIGREMGLSPAQIQAEFSLTPNQYAAALKRLLRAIAKGALDGLK